MAQVNQIPVFIRDALDADMQYLHAPRPGRRQTFYGEFEMDFNAVDLPPGMREISAWTFDFPYQTAARMPGLYRIDTEKKSVEAIADPEAEKPR